PCFPTRRSSDLISYSFLLIKKWVCCLYRGLCGIRKIVEECPEQRVVEVRVHLHRRRRVRLERDHDRLVDLDLRHATTESDEWEIDREARVLLDTEEVERDVTVLTNGSNRLNVREVGLNFGADLEQTNRRVEATKETDRLVERDVVVDVERQLRDEGKQRGRRLVGVADQRQLDAREVR